MIGILIGFSAGMCFGVGLTSCLVAAKREDVRMVMCQINIGKLICFVDHNGKELFQIPDGGCIQLVSNSGDRQVSICRYVDEEHAQIDGIVWQMQKFAERMVGNGIEFWPLSS